ncbi:unnamed protein product, partial [Mesorhabditis spiculigera]
MNSGVTLLGPEDSLFLGNASEMRQGNYEGTQQDSNRSEQHSDLLDRLVCPYDEMHLDIDRIDFEDHLSRCRGEYMRMFPHCPILQCTYNADHWVPDREYPFHRLHCPNSEEYFGMMSSKGGPTTPWIAEPKKEDREGCHTMTLALADFEATEYVIRMGAVEPVAEDSDDSEELICQSQPVPKEESPYEFVEIHSDDDFD